jgi:beta-glucosidase
VVSPWPRLGAPTSFAFLYYSLKGILLSEQGYPPVNFDAQHSDGSGALNLNVNVRTAAHTALVREIAAASAVLLKNNRTVNAAGTTVRGLPAVLGVAKTVAIIGKDALLPNLACNDLNECNDGTMSIGCI